MKQLDRRSFLRTGGVIVAGTAFAGCTQSDDEDVSFGIEKVRYFTEQPTEYRPDGTFEVDTDEDETFDVDGVVWIYAEPVGVAREPTEDGNARFELTKRLEIVTPDGETIESEEETIGETILPEATLDELFVFWYFSPPTDASLGSYAGSIELTDEVAGETVTETVEFTIQ